MILHFIFLLGLQSVFAIDTDTKSPNAYVQSIDMMALLELFTSIEGDEQQPETFKEKIRALKKKETWVHIKNNLNLFRVGMDSYRVYKMNTSGSQNTNNQSRVEHIQNLAIILPLSHGVETLAGEVSMLIAANMGASIGSIATIGLVGAIIKIPLLVDPICIIFVTAYKYSPHFRQGITKIRTSTASGFSFMSDVTGLRTFWNKFFYHKEVMEQLYQLRNKNWTVEINDTISLRKNGVEIEVGFSENNYFVKRVRADQFDPKILRDLPLNIRYALRRVFLKDKAEFYIESSSIDKKDIVFKDYSLPWNPKLSRKKQCYHLFDF
ncbi:MAG: hypothetical protein KDD37_07610 [Bdellovibrionales bacterium]|nr:hypothetical protein [Bdellovibrionales bacterium]